mmetsp:Transcript_1691/g.3410  ORF Transcript_1691/g.3410 Transcript_1691/m.3410 type:complete len:275 (-) Transcript_1691:272-1096(-)|eukprot:CAMPEP_0118933384 /NCGR_PEP_ID=MMETSP1169-20130426/11958_1 /TAXON_ID=36882 /ORGANISM="Pyramimonas obovata, Strain CCMP722" /LENGTH=274 /DNA_ID=CAMNT_0006876139 /DNA_START=54 /DNA_END=878 /DNA_ORIENTATION=-
MTRLKPLLQVARTLLSTSTSLVEASPGKWLHNASARGLHAAVGRSIARGLSTNLPMAGSHTGTAGFASNAILRTFQRSLLPTRVLEGNSQLVLVSPTRGLHTSVLLRQVADKGGEVQTRKDEYDEITDVIPPKPVSAVEGTSYSIVIIAGLAVLLGAAYAVISELFFEGKEYTVFNKSLERIQQDPRVSVRLGSPITGYGAEGRSRSARGHIRHREYYGPDNMKHMQVQFLVRGPSGNASVHADMYLDDMKEWKYQYLYLEFGSGSRIVIESPP